VRWPRASTVFGAAFVVWGVAIGLVRLHDNSFLTHVATGRLILAHGVPTTDPYTFTAHGHPWVVESWLASLVYALVERAEGGHGLQLLHAALGGALGALAWTLTRPARQLPGRIVAAAGLVAVGTGYWSPRPLLIALALLGALVVLVETDSPRVWLAVPLMWVWVNVHGNWPFGLAYLVLRMLGRHADAEPMGRLPRLAAFSAVGTALGALNPLGFRLLTYPAVVLTHHAAFAHIVEWQSPTFSDTVNAVFLAQVLMAVVLLVVRHGGIEDVLPAVVFTAAALLAARNVPVAALVVTPVLARGVAGLGTITGSGRGPAPAIALTALTALGVVLVGTALGRPAYDLSSYPVTEVTWLQRHHLAPGRVIAPDYVGNYLEFRFGARASVFVDDRVDVLPGSVEHDYGVLLGGSPGWQAVLARYHAQAVLWPRAEPLSGLLALAPGWTEPVRDRRWIVAVPLRASRRA
jgi:hypothetical protein